MMAESCCNPFNLPKHNWSSRKKKLRPVAKWMCDKAEISLGSKICDFCRKKLAKIPDLESEIRTEAPCLSHDPTPCASPQSPADRHSFSDYHYVDVPEAMAAVNKCLLEIGVTPFSKRAGHKAIDEKINRVTEAMKSLVISDRPEVSSHSCSSDEGEMIAQLKEKFQSTTKRSEQLQILTVLPKSWAMKRIQSEFGVSDYMARKCKQLVRDKGVLSSPDPKPGQALSLDIIKTVTDFYESDEVSRMMPGKKDFVSTKQQGQRIQVQKRLILGNLKEVYCPNKKIGFSKFAELRPKCCILAGASGTHSVCVCTIHQNVKLMFVGAKLSEITTPEGIEYATYHHCLASIVCNPPLPICFLGKCTSCPGLSYFRQNLTTLLDENLIDNITFKQWVSVDRSTLETHTKTVDEFIDVFCEKLELLRPHSFLASQQAAFYTECKSTLAPREVLVTVDFSENYSFVLQDAAQGYHWNNSQATIHPFIAYYKKRGELCHVSFVIVSECLHHDTTAVYLYQSRFIAFLRKFLPSRSQPQKIIYFSDGAASQYKNRKNFINLCHHKEDFKILAEWHFSATAHGKSACDGIGGTVKRLAARASLQKPYNNQIMTPRQLFDWASANITTTHFDYCSSDDYKMQQMSLEQRFLKARTIPGTRKLHTFIPVSQDTLLVKPFSTSSYSRRERITCTEDHLPTELIAGFVTCRVGGTWWLACVLQLDLEENEVKLTLLHPSGPSKSFRYPPAADVATVSVEDILTAVDPRTRGRTYTLTSKETKSASEKFLKGQ